MKCKNCGAEGDGNFCEHCGARLTENPAWEAPSQPSHQAPPQQQTQPPYQVQPPVNASLSEKKSGWFAKKWWIPVLAGAVLLIVIVAVTRPKTEPASSGQTQSQNAAVSSTAKETAAQKTTGKAAGPYTAELSNGNFTAGIDFPAGTYDIEAVSGNGNVYSDNMISGGVNLIMGVASDGNSQKTFKNARFPKGVVLTVSSVKIKITSAKADTGAMTKRTNTAAKTVKLTPGNYTAGTDFDAGIYDITAVSGGGNVISSNPLAGGINAVMGVDSNEMYQKEYKNIVLTKGVTLTITEVTVQLAPSK